MHRDVNIGLGLLLFLGQELLRCVSQFAQGRFHRAPDDLSINAVVMMGQQVTQPGDFPPGNQRLPGQQVGGQRLDGLADQAFGSCPGAQSGRFIPKPNPRGITQGQGRSWPAHVVRQRPLTCLDVRCDPVGRPPDP
jgi:hypothetical protein